jgi:predicted AlkP superfamily pyrophosphatase or phosphodiesterase
MKFTAKLPTSTKLLLKVSKKNFFVYDNVNEQTIISWIISVKEDCFVDAVTIRLVNFGYFFNSDSQ